MAAHLFYSIGSCHLDYYLGSLLVEVAAITAEAYRLALYLVTQGVK